MQLQFLGTGDARQVPVHGCTCQACEQARQHPERRRRACSALLELQGYRLMIDAGRTDLCELFEPGELSAVLLTHYHMDHVMGLFHLRWGANQTIPVFGPDDPAGCDDLYKHPGILDFRPPLAPFIRVELGPFQVTPLPLNHSKPTQGYYIRGAGASLAYLTDTVGLPEATLAWLQTHRPDRLVLDCSMPPKPEPPRNHNDLTLALELIRTIQPARAFLTHVGHQLDEYWLEHPHLPDAVEVARDGLRLQL